MRRKLIGLLIIGVLLLVGCTQVTPISNTTITNLPATNNTGNNLYEATHNSTNWINPGIIAITIEPTMLGTNSASAGYNIRIHNGEDYPVTYSINIMASQFCSSEYEQLPTEYYKWIVISNPNPYILAKETKEVWIGFNIPVGDKDSPWLNKKYEVITQYVMGGQGNTQTATGTRWQLILA